MADPNALLKNIQAILGTDMTEHDGVMLAANVESLHRWITSGGSLPDEWKPRCTASDGTLTCVLPRHYSDYHETRDGKFWSLKITLNVPLDRTL